MNEIEPWRRDIRDHNAWVEEAKDGVEFQPLRDFLDMLKEPEEDEDLPQLPADG